MHELVLHDAAGDFLLVHGTGDYLSLARRADTKGEVPLVRFAPQHAAVLAAALEAVLAEPASPLVVRAGSDVLRLEALDRPGGPRVRVANLARRRPGTMEPEALELDRRVAAGTVTALRGPVLAPLGPARAAAVYDDGAGRAAGVESGDGATTVSAKTERTWARARFSTSLRRVVAACFATVVGNPGESAIRVAHVEREGDTVLLERLATAVGPFPYAVAEARPGRPSRPRRTVRLTHDMAAWVLQCLARDDDNIALPAAPTAGPDRAEAEAELSE